MASSSENSFGARLRRAQDLQTYIAGFTGYAPPRTQETLTAYTALVTSIVAINASESSLQQNYKAAVDLRQAAFSKTAGSVDKLLAPIRGAVEAQYGKKSTEVTVISGLIKTMRSTKLIRLPIDPAAPDVEKTISRSERSYGSVTQYFNDIINTISQFTAYNPTNNTIKLPALQANALQLTTLNNAVAQKIQVLTVARASRQTIYTDLKERVQRIKAYVKAQYGTNSNEYNIIKGLKI